MGFFDRLMGREVVRNEAGEEVGTFAKGGWDSLREGKWSETTQASQSRMRSSLSTIVEGSVWALY